MYSGTTDNNFTWNILVNKLASIGRVPFDCASSSGDCFFTSMGHSLYSNADLHAQIHSAEITHMINHPELYFESVAYESWEHYIQEMSKRGTWWNNIIIQAVANVLSCTIHITDSDLNAINPTIITPLNSHQKQRIVFLGYINDLHYVSTLQDSQNQNAVKIISSIKRKVFMSVNKRNQVLARKRKLEKQRRASETNDAKKLRLEKQTELDKQRRANETSDARKLRLEKKTKRDKQHRASETNDARKLRLQKKSKVDKQHRTSETDDAKQLRLRN